jgi:hypothetical protein
MTEMTYEARWYWCTLVDSSITTELPEPDWSRVPASKLEHVRAQFEQRKAQAKPLTERVKLWGPQIPFFEKQPEYTVTVHEPAEGA